MMNKVFYVWIILLGISSCTPKEVEEKKVVNQEISEEQQKKENLEKRLQALTQLIQQKPSDVALYAERANLYYLLGDSLNCFQDINFAIKNRPNDSEFHYLKGFYAYNYNELDTAMFWFRKADTNLSKNPEVPYQIGNIYVIQKDFSSSLKWYDKALELDKNSNYLYAKAFSLKNLKKLLEALQICNQSLQLDSLHAKTLSLLVEIYLFDYQNYAKANEWNQKLLKQDSLPVGHYLEGMIYFQKAIRLDDTKQKEEKEGLLRLAIESYSKAIKRDPYYSKAFYDRGYAFFLLQRYDLATQSFEEVLRQNPKDYRAAFMLGSIAEFYEDKELAKSYYQLALKINPEFEEAEKAIEEL